MSEPEDLDAPLSRTAASAAVAGIGWRYLLGALSASVPVRSLAQASEAAAAAVAACGPDANAHLRVDLRPDRVELSVQARALNAATGRDARLAHRVSAALAELGLTPASPTSASSPRPVQALELAIDALDIAAIRPFWKAVLGYADEPGGGGQNGIVDPAGCLRNQARNLRWRPLGTAAAAAAAADIRSLPLASRQRGRRPPRAGEAGRPSRGHTACDVPACRAGSLRPAHSGPARSAPLRGHCPAPGRREGSRRTPRPSRRRESPRRPRLR